jgi:hypothetical protein
VRFAQASTSAALKPSAPWTITSELQSRAAIRIGSPSAGRNAQERVVV